MKQNDEIKELFSQKLANHEAPVNPELWNAIASKIATAPLTGVAAAKGVSLSLKTIVSIVTIASIGVSTVYLLMTEKEKQVSKNTISQVLDESKTPELIQETIPTTKQTPTTKEFDNSSVVNKETYKKETSELVKSSFSENMSNEVISESSVKTVSETENKTTTSSQKTDDNSIKTNKEEQTTTNSISSSVEVSEQEIKLPNIVTPNNDGENDLFWINTKNLQDFSITILNDKNKVVFTSSDPDFKWDGKDQLSNLVPIGTYIYFFTAKDQSGKLISKSSKLEVKY